MNTDLALFVVLRLRHVTCGFLKKRRNYFIAAQNKIDPSSLAVTDQLICTQGKRRVTLDHVPFHNMIFQQYFYNFLLHEPHTYLFFFFRFLHLRFPELCLYHLYYIFLLNLFLSFCCSSTFTLS